MYCKNHVGSDKTLNDSIVACNLDSQCPGVYANCGVDFRICQSPIEEAQLPCGPILYVKGTNLPYIHIRYNIPIKPICFHKICCFVSIFSVTNTIVGIAYLQGQGDNDKITGILLLTQKVSHENPDIAFETTIRGRIPNLNPGEYTIQVHSKEILENNCKTKLDHIEFQVSPSLSIIHFGPSYS